MSDILNQCGVILRRLRVAAKKSLQDVRDVSGIPFSLLNKYEGGVMAITKSHLEAYARSVGLSPDHYHPIPEFAASGDSLALARCKYIEMRYNFNIREPHTVLNLTGHCSTVQERIDGVMDLNPQHQMSLVHALSCGERPTAMVIESKVQIICGLATRGVTPFPHFALIDLASPLAPDIAKGLLRLHICPIVSARGDHVTIYDTHTQVPMDDPSITKLLSEHVRWRVDSEDTPCLAAV